MKKKEFIQLVTLTKPPIGLLIIGLILSVSSAVVGLGLPLLMKGVMENLSSGIPPKMIIGIILCISVWIGSSVFSIYILQYVGLKVVQRLREKLWKKLLSLPISFYSKEQSGELISRITNDTTILRELVSQQMISFLTNSITLAGATVILFALDVPMTLVLLLSVPVILIVIIPAGERLYKISVDEQQKMSTLTAFLAETLSEIRLIKAYGGEQLEYENGNKSFHSLFTYGLKRAKVEAVLGPLITIVSLVMFTFVIGFGAYRVGIGALTAGSLIAFLLYLFQIIAPITVMGEFFSSYQKAKGATERLRSILNEEEEDVDTGEVLKEIEEISFEHVGYAYGDKQVLEDISFSAKKGEVIAFVGPSGVGKSTIFGLMEQFLKPVSGEIKVNGESLSKYQLKSWRSNISYVQQDSPLLIGTIKENLLYGVETDKEEEALIDAAKLAGSYDFIMDSEAGFESVVGERGRKLSGGQKQRIAIARAILRNPSVLLFDEATASLDTESERIIQDSMKQLEQGRITFIIAHRLSTVVDADKIIVMEGGRISGIGTHEDLLATHAFYRTLVSQQMVGTSKE